jgi:hypothetical protein
MKESDDVCLKVSRSQVSPPLGGCETYETKSHETKMRPVRLMRPIGRQKSTPQQRSVPIASYFLVYFRRFAIARARVRRTAMRERQKPTGYAHHR